MSSFTGTGIPELKALEHAAGGDCAVDLSLFTVIDQVSKECPYAVVIDVRISAPGEVLSGKTLSELRDCLALRYAIALKQWPGAIGARMGPDRFIFFAPASFPREISDVIPGVLRQAICAPIAGWSALSIRACTAVFRRPDNESGKIFVKRIAGLDDLSRSGSLRTTPT